MRRGILRSATPDRAWQRGQRATRRWAIWGAVAGALLGMAAYAPAALLASAVQSATDERLQLADAQGSVWSGSAVLVLAGGPGSRDASALPGRLHWHLVPQWQGISLRAEHACCLNGELRLLLQPNFGGWTLQLPPRAEGIGQWPARWLAGLGTPWNTLQLGGMLHLASPGMTLQWVQGRARLSGSMQLDMLGTTSRLSPLGDLGSYRITLTSQAAAGDPAIKLETLDGALRLTGSGQWTGAHLRFRGQAAAAEGQESALSNLLNIIGRRQGALSVISIG